MMTKEEFYEIESLEEALEVLSKIKVSEKVSEAEKSALMIARWEYLYEKHLPESIKERRARKK